MAISDFSVVCELGLATTGGRIEWDEDISDYLIDASISRGRRTALDRMAPGIMVLTLNNLDGRFSPEKGTLVGLDDYTPIRLYRQWTTPAATNIFANPRAQDNATGWNESGGATVTHETTEQPRRGANCVKVALVAGGAQGVILQKLDSTNLPVAALTDYAVSADAKCPAGESRTSKFLILWYTAADVFISASLGPIFTMDDDWQRFSFAATSPATAAKAEVRLQESADQGVYDIFVDGGMFEAATAASPYVDGAQPGCSWAGAADASGSSRSANPKFLLFEGFISAFNLQEDPKTGRASLQAVDRLGLIAEKEIDLFYFVKSAWKEIINRILDVSEKNPKLANGENQEIDTAGATRPNTDWSGLGSTIATGTSALQRPQSEATDDEWLFGDWRTRCLTDNVAAGEGLRYDATSDLTALGKWKIVCYVRRSGGSDQAMELRLMRDATEVGSTAFTMTDTYQRIELDVDHSATLGTNRYIDIVTTSQAAATIIVQGLRAVPYRSHIERSIDDGASILQYVAADGEPSGAVLADVLRSEPGIGYMAMASVPASNDDSVTWGAIATFEDIDSRPAADEPSAVFGDGDGLPGFGHADLVFDPRQRYDSVRIASRGSISAPATAQAILWGLTPIRDLASGEVLRFRFPTLARQIKIDARLGGGQFTNLTGVNRIFGTGGSIITTAAMTSGDRLFVAGVQYVYLVEQSESIAEDLATGLAIPRTLPVDMPHQGTVTTEMDTEAARLLAKYKERVKRLDLTLNQWGRGASDLDEDEVHLWQLGLELSDLIHVVADEAAQSGGVDSDFYVEGIGHSISKGGVLETVLHLEEP